ncbi:hypothetical protein E2C01_048607 [Portunus trituberculatus]|uniref:Uncharacterized protein n=1 Tax=Portunus trituberculatus TaxID=210409 RepID=A0A5B7GBK7_PORTR|nr:hypothetical protein [Portunus trituberculatus]
MRAEEMEVEMIVGGGRGREGVRRSDWPRLAFTRITQRPDGELRRPAINTALGSGSRGRVTSSMF